MFIYLFWPGLIVHPGKPEIPEGKRHQTPGRAGEDAGPPAPCSSTDPVAGGSGFPQERKLVVTLQGLILHYRLCLSHGGGSDLPGNTFY